MGNWCVPPDSPSRGSPVSPHILPAAREPELPRSTRFRIRQEARDKRIRANFALKPAGRTLAAIRSVADLGVGDIIVLSYLGLDGLHKLHWHVDPDDVERMQFAYPFRRAWQSEFDEQMRRCQDGVDPCNALLRFRGEFN